MNIEKDLKTKKIIDAYQNELIYLADKIVNLKALVASFALLSLSLLGCILYLINLMR